MKPVMISAPRESGFFFYCVDVGYVDKEA